MHVSRVAGLRAVFAKSTTRSRDRLGRQDVYLRLPQRAVERMAVDEHYARASPNVIERGFHVTTLGSSARVRDAGWANALEHGVKRPVPHPANQVRQRVNLSTQRGRAARAPPSRQ